MGTTATPVALEWIAPTDRTDGRERRLFVVDRQGILSHGFHNVATHAQLEQAIADVLA